jgi:dTDP-4-dehydrorhamnose reductase/dTDP-4-dehydrorhamnose 3,5-epimerase
MSELRIESTTIPGLLVVHLPLHDDNRGWFKENWQREKMIKLGLPDFRPVQNNISFNSLRGVTRGFHAEPWDKFVSVATGRVFGAWIDLREGEGFGTTVSLEIDPATAVFVPRGVANAYQALEASTAYTYLVNAHWRPAAEYLSCALDDPRASVPWPIPLTDSEISEKDQQNPSLNDLTPIKHYAPHIVVLGASGQVGRALLARFPTARGLTREMLDAGDPSALRDYDWSGVDVVINAAAMTAVDDAESDNGRAEAWATNAHGPAQLAALSIAHDFTLIHLSSDYVFDGAAAEHDEDELFSPLGVYGQSKAAGDLAVAVAPRHYIIRTSWVVGDGKNFVRTMVGLAEKGAKPRVVDDQLGRLTFTADIADAIMHLLQVHAPFGTYNITSTGRVSSWADLARRVFEFSGRPVTDVFSVSTEEFARGKEVSSRPKNSALSIAKICKTGFVPADQDSSLVRYLIKEKRLRPSNP